METKLNCWEFHDCKSNITSTGQKDFYCAVKQAIDCNGVNNGTNGGRVCWSIAGTLCNTDHPGCFTSEVESCLECKFYKLVLKEEKEKLVLFSNKSKP